MTFLHGLLYPDVQRHLLTTEREYIVDEVQRHWITRLPGAGLVLLGIALFVTMPLLRDTWWIGCLAGLASGLVGFWRIHLENMDRFVLTNMRVFRVNGVFNQHMASVPIARILDISVERPLIGQVLDFGHFVFESAAQEQGLKRIRFVPDIERRDLRIQTVIQRAGLRARVGEDRDDLFAILDHLEEDADERPRRRHLRRHDRATPSVDPDELDGV